MRFAACNSGIARKYEQIPKGVGTVPAGPVLAGPLEVMEV